MPEATFKQGNPLMVDHTPGSAVAAGEVLVASGVCRIAHLDMASGDLGALAAGGGVYDVARLADGSDDWADGVQIFWDASENRATTASTGNTHLGYAVGAVTGTAASGMVHHTPA